MSPSHAALPLKKVILITSGDLRQSANQVCWPAQEDLERQLTEAFREEGVSVERAFPVDAAKGHGFISSQRMGMDVFAGIDPEASLVFATAAWQYSHHVLPGLRSHRGPILTVANWSGQWPGLVGMLNLNGSLVKAGVPFTLALERGLHRRVLPHRPAGVAPAGKRHARSLARARPRRPNALPASAKSTGEELAAKLLKRKAIMGVFDEGCMGMYNAIIDDELLNPPASTRSGSASRRWWPGCGSSATTKPTLCGSGWMRKA